MNNLLDERDALGLYIATNGTLDYNQTVGSTLDSTDASYSVAVSSFQTLITDSAYVASDNTAFSMILSQLLSGNNQNAAIRRFVTTRINFGDPNVSYTATINVYSNYTTRLTALTVAHASLASLGIGSVLTTPAAAVVSSLLARNGVLYTRSAFFGARGLQTIAIAQGRWTGPGLAPLIGTILFGEYIGLIQTSQLDTQRYGATAGPAVEQALNVSKLRRMSTVL